MKAQVLFLDGKMIRAEEQLLNALTPGSMAGRGVFETMRVFKGQVLFLKEHLARLRRSLKVLKVHTPYSDKKLKYHIQQVIRTNRFQQARMRLAVWKESEHSHISIIGNPFEGYAPNKYKKGFKVVFAKTRRPKTRLSHIKSIDYGCFKRAFVEAQKQKCDEAILLNNAGELVEGSRTNIFFVKRGILYTPATRCGCLNGITRQIVLRLAREMNISCRMVAAQPGRLLQADEAFVTNSLMGVMPLTIVAKRIIGQKTAGPVTKKLLDAYQTIFHSSCPSTGKSV